ncbi:MAG: cytochrome b6-f complex iron-sulfur subunit [Flavobacteriales bacterium]|jgi:cytochrome b6-f complex iron-sulfur subunit
MSSRRYFLKNSVLASAACCIVPSLILGGCNNLQLVAFEKLENPNQLKIKKTAFEKSNAVIINDPSQEAQIFLKKETEGYKALLMLCTHKSCDVALAGAVFVCPCHGSEFSKSGAVLTGPATKPLIEFNTTTDDTYVYVQL